MSGIGGVILAIYLIRALLAAAQKSSDGESESQAPQSIRPKTRARRFVLWAFLLLSLWTIPSMGQRFGIFGTIGMSLVATFFAFPTLWADWLAIPRGWSSLAQLFGAFSLRRFRYDPACGAIVHGALALLNVPPEKRGEALSQLQSDLANLKGPVNGDRAFARALLELHRDPKAAAALFEAAQTFSPKACSPWVRARCNEYLALFAIEQGDFAQVDWALENRPNTGMQKLLAFLAETFASPPSLQRSAFILWWRWLNAPHRRLTKPVVELAAQGRPLLERKRTIPMKTHEAVARKLTPMQRALYFSLLTERDPSLLIAAGHAWEDVLEGQELDAQLSERAMLLGANDTFQARDDIRVCAEASLASAFERGPRGLGSTIPSVLSQSVSRHTDALFEQLERMTEQLRERTAAQRKLPSLEELDAFIQLRRVYELLAKRSADTRSMAFGVIGNPVTNYASWLHNSHDERVLSHVIFQFVAREARAAGDAELYRLNSSNARIADSTL